MFSFVSASRIERLERRVDRQGAIIERLCAQLGIDPVGVDPDGRLDATELSLVLQGHEIQAIKHLRERTGAGLAEAKRIVDAAH